MASRLVREWFRDQLEAWQAAHPDPDPLACVFKETVNEAPDPKTMPPTWSTLIFPTTTAAAISIGSPACRRESGSVDIVLAGVAGLHSDGDVMRLAEALRDELRERSERLAVATVIRTQEPQPPSTPEDAEGRWFYAFVSVPFECDYFK